MNLSPLEHHYALIQNQSLHYASQGQGELLLFLHGFPQYWQAWEKQLTFFSKDYRTVAVDLRGFNLSSKPTEVADYKIEVLVEDIHQLILHLGYTKASLVGHDWGGSIAWDFAARYPQHIEKLMVINAVPLHGFARTLLHNSQQRLASQYIHMVRAIGSDRFLMQNEFERLFFAFKQRQPAWDLSETEKDRYRASWKLQGESLLPMLNYYRATPIFPPQNPQDLQQLESFAGSSTEMYQVTAPVLAIWGEKDTALLSENLDTMKDYANDLQIQRIPEASHWVVEEYPEKVNQLITQFLYTQSH
jgi:epoxide hydrolase 4